MTDKQTARHICIGTPWPCTRPSTSSQYGENSEALYLTSGYVQPDAETAARRFAGEEQGYTYSRLGNPTVTSMEMRLAALEGTEAALPLPPACLRFC